MKNQNYVFYVKAQASWKNSERRKGGYFSYFDIKKENCLIKVTGSEAVIIDKNNNYTVKRLSGKYFDFTGKKVTEKTFKKHLLKIEKTALELKELYKAAEIAEKEKQEAERNKIISEIKEKITPELIAKWTAEGANEGNAHTRRTRWMNRYNRLFHKPDGQGVRNGTLLRDIVFETCYNETK